ncbi:MAG: ABC transporter ATP-binding protein [Tissierellales bacterium]|jgi:ABC-type multidrug transport system ATPase subunit|nr:ABC transporter ATP-binding protein [Tissierellales bacterium]
MKLRIKEVSKSYKDKKVLSSVSFTLEEGVYGLVGPNGAGKTTLMNIIVGLLKADGGEVLFKSDENSDNNKWVDLPIEYIGFLPQYPMFYRNFTAKEFLHYMTVLKDYKTKDIDKYIDELLKLVNLDDEKNKKIGSFSGGMKQRLGIAQTIINEPKILIFDEPTAGLDPRERIRFRNIISSIAKDRIVILATHIVTDISFIAKEVILLKNGLLIRKGTQEYLENEIYGKVWETKTASEEIINYMSNFKVSNVVNEKDGYNIRVVNDEKPNSDAVEVVPTLEDVCLYYFDEV